MNFSSSVIAPFAAKTGVLIPTRGDRQKLLQNCIRQACTQTQKPDVVQIIDYAPKSNRVDLVPRVREGIERLKFSGVDWVFIFEDDDYYPPGYIEFITQHRRPGTMAAGFNETYYYHIRKREWLYLNHPLRASLFTTSFQINALDNFRWPKDEEVFLDIHIWEHLIEKYRQNLLLFRNIKSPIGIKHGVGKTAGKGHSVMRYTETDPEMEWLAEKTDRQAVKFYKNFFQ